jgi:hypothetical protein
MGRNSKDPIIVYWSPFMKMDGRKRDWSFLYPEPQTLFIDTVKNKRKESGKDSYFACPAVASKIKKILVFNSPMRSSHEFNFENDNEYLEPTDEVFLYLDKTRPASSDNGPTLIYSLSYIFFAEEPLDIYFTPPMFHEPKYMKYGSIIPGEFDVGQWFRPYNFEVQTWKNKGEIHLEEDEPIFYAEFKTDRPIILKKFNCNDVLSSYAEANATSSFVFGRGEGLIKKYKRFKDVGFREKILTEIKKNLIDENPTNL